MHLQADLKSRGASSARSDAHHREVARQAGLKTSAIRYYESVGLLPEPERQSGQRRYGADTLRRLQVIDVAKRAGFSLDEARVLLATSGGGPPATPSCASSPSASSPRSTTLIARAQAVRAWLVTASGCDCDTLDVCALFDADAPASPGVRVTRVAAPL